MRRILLPLLIVACCAALIAAVWPQSSSTHLKASLAREVVTTTSSTSTTSSTTTTSTTEPPTTTTTAYVRHTVQSTPPRSTPQPRPSGGVATRPSRQSGYATSCMDNAPHTAALAHSCWDGLLAKYPWSQARAFSVLMCESEGNPWDYNSSSATGLMQELGGPTDPASNIAVAYDMYSHRGWQPWDASHSCWVSAQKG